MVVLKMPIFLKLCQNSVYGQRWEIFWESNCDIRIFLEHLFPNNTKSIGKISWHFAKCWQIEKRKPNCLWENGSWQANFIFLGTCLHPFGNFLKASHRKSQKFPKLPIFWSPYYRTDKLLNLLINQNEKIDWLGERKWALNEFYFTRELIRTHKFEKDFESLATLIFCHILTDCNKIDKSFIIGHFLPWKVVMQ